MDLLLSYYSGEKCQFWRFCKHFPGNSVGNFVYGKVLKYEVLLQQNSEQLAYLLSKTLHNCSGLIKSQEFLCPAKVYKASLLQLSGHYNESFCI